MISIQTKHPISLILLILLSLALTAFGCQNSTLKPKQTKYTTELLKKSITTDKTKNKMHSSAFAVIKGGILKKPLFISQWIEVYKNDNDQKEPKCKNGFLHQVFTFGKERIYINQNNMRCGKSNGCKLYNQKTNTFQNLRHCLSSPTSGRFSIQPLGFSLFFIYGYQEGPGLGHIVWWDGKKPQKSLFEYVTSSKKFIRQKKSYIIYSACHPKKGLIPEVTWSKETCQVGSKECGYCARMYGKVFRWKWDLKTGEIHLLKISNKPTKK